MLYQKILSNDSPYKMTIGPFRKFDEHRHPDIEFHYCIRGSFDILIDKTLYHLNEGEVALVGPMVSHEVPDAPDNSRLVLMTIVGHSFLKKHFDLFSNSSFLSPVCKLNEDSEEHKKLRELFEETVELYQVAEKNRELLLTGNLYKICAYLLNELSEPSNSKDGDKKDLRKISNIEKALDLIYYNYKNPVTVDDAAEATGYAKSNFCKIFKSITGDSFHMALNRQRIKIACGFLKYTDMPIADIAAEVGFSETKTFCRVFKAIIGVSPGVYRRSDDE